MAPLAFRRPGRTRLLVLAIACFVFGRVALAAPNILLILADDLGYGEVNVSDGETELSAVTNSKRKQVSWYTLMTLSLWR